jgi:hypothetical protein
MRKIYENECRRNSGLSNIHSFRFCLEQEEEQLWWLLLWVQESWDWHAPLLGATKPFFSSNFWIQCLLLEYIQQDLF